MVSRCGTTSRMSWDCRYCARPWRSICAKAAACNALGNQRIAASLYILARMLDVRKGVFIEDPGYVGARNAFASAGAILTPVPVDQGGIALPPGTLTQGSAVYTTPSRQFPTGACLPVARRLALIEAADQANAWIIEDDYDSEFRYTGAPVPSLHSLDAAGPHHLYRFDEQSARAIAAYRLCRAASVARGTLRGGIVLYAYPSLPQRVRTALDTFLTAAATAKLPMEFRHTNGGMNLTGYFPDDRQPALRGFDIPQLSRYRLDPGRQGLVFGFTAWNHAAIRLAMKRLGEAWGTV